MIRHFEIGCVTEGAVGLMLGILPADWWVCRRCDRVNRLISDDELERYQTAFSDLPDLADPRCMQEAEEVTFGALHGLTPRGACGCRRPTPGPPRPGGYWNYILWGEGGRLLYVGMTRHAPARFRQHKRRPAWGVVISDVTWIECADAEEMVRDEAERIRAFQPPLNFAGV